MQVKYDGLTGWIEFDNLSLRSNISVEILELGELELKPVGTWKYGFGNWTDRLRIEREIPEIIVDHSDTSLEGRFLKVLTALVNINKVKLILMNECLNQISSLRPANFFAVRSIHHVQIRI